MWMRFSGEIESDDLSVRLTYDPWLILVRVTM